MKFYLTKRDRDKIHSTLQPEQQKFLKDKLKRGKKTSFANVLAQSKALNNTSNQDLLTQIQSWELVEYIDAGMVSPDLKCECGRSLRYQYVVENQKTKETRSFGVNHLQEHTGIPPNIAKEIIKGLSIVDYELDEILVKVKANWRLSKIGFTIPINFPLPSDINEHLKLELPLLDKQISRLSRLVQEFQRKEASNSLLPKKKINKNTTSHDLNKTIEKIKGHIKPLEFDFATDELNAKQQQVIVAFVSSANEEFSTRKLCEFLIDIKLVKSERLNSGKPKIYPYVIMFLEFLSSKGRCFLVRSDLSDRVYKSAK